MAIPSGACRAGLHQRPDHRERTRGGDQDIDIGPAGRRSRMNGTRFIIYSSLLTLTLSGSELPGQVTQLDEIKRIEERLKATVEWEILWDASPNGFRYKPNQQANVAIYVQAGLLSYCSADLGLCVQYATPVRRYWEFAKSMPHLSGRRDEDVLLEFAAVAPSPAKAPPPRNEVAGILERTEGQLWTASFTLLSVDKIVQLYRTLRPNDIESLQEKVRPLVTGGTYESLTIPCYRRSDFYVPIYGHRIENGSIVFGLFWDPDVEGWVESGVMAREEDNSELAERFRKRILSIRCATVERKR